MKHEGDTPDFYGENQERKKRTRASRALREEQEELEASKREAVELINKAAEEQEKVRWQAWEHANARYEYHKALMLEAKAGESW